MGVPIGGDSVILGLTKALIGVSGGDVEIEDEDEDCRLGLNKETGTTEEAWDVTREDDPEVVQSSLFSSKAAGHRDESFIWETSQRWVSSRDSSEIDIANILTFRLADLLEASLSCDEVDPDGVSPRTEAVLFLRELKDLLLLIE